MAGSRSRLPLGFPAMATYPFTYGIFVGADLFAGVEAPSAFNWPKKTFPLASVPAKAAKPGGTCPTGSTTPAANDSDLRGLIGKTDALDAAIT